MGGKTVMNAEDTISGTLAECQVIWDGKSYNFIQAIRLDARFEKIKGKDGKIIGWRGNGQIVFHYNDSIFWRILVKSKETGDNIYFDMLVTNDDPSARMGRQTILLKNCCIESGTLAEFDAESGYLVDDMKFTFEDFEFMEKFQCQG